MYPFSYLFLEKVKEERVGQSEGRVRASEKTPSLAEVRKNCILGKNPQLLATTTSLAGVESCEQRADADPGREAAFPKPWLPAVTTDHMGDHRPHARRDMCEHRLSSWSR